MISDKGQRKLVQGTFSWRLGEAQRSEEILPLTNQH